MSYRHLYKIIGVASDPYSEANDHYIREIYFFVTTKDLNSNTSIMCNSHVTVTLPSPNPNNFIPYKDVNREKQLEWISQFGDSDLILRIEQENIQKLQNGNI